MQHNKRITITISTATPPGQANVQYTVKAKPTTTPETAPHGASAQALALNETCVQRCRHPAVGSLVASFLHESEIFDVMARPLEEGEKESILGHCIDQAAVRMRDSGSPLGSHARECVYAAALIVGIAAEFHGYGDSTPIDLVRSITCLALHRLDDSDPMASSYVRELLGWGNVDEMDEEVARCFSAVVRQYLDQELNKQAIQSHALMSKGVTLLLPAQPPAQGSFPH